MSHLSYPTSTGVALAAVGDPGRDRTVYATILLLVALGFALIMLAVWLFRNTRPDPQVLAPLERMGERRWRGADPVWQHRSLDEVRPREANPLEPSSAPPATDDEFERGPQPIGFDDLVASNTTTVAPASGLPAPLADALPVEGPVEDVAAGGGDAVADAGDSDAAEAVSDEEAATNSDDDDDDEDITGEQDGDDFLAVLDPAGDVDLDIDVEADSDPDAGPGADIERDVEAASKPDPDPTPDNGPDPDPDPTPDVEADPDPDRDIGADSDSADDEDVVAG